MHFRPVQVSSKDQFISSVTIEICKVYLLSVELIWTAGVSACFLQMAEGIPAADWLIA